MFSGALSFESCGLKALRTSIENSFEWLAPDRPIGDDLEQFLHGIEKRSMLNTFNKLHILNYRKYVYGGAKRETNI